MRPLRPFCGTVLKAQLLTLPATISTSANGVVTTQLSFLPPASSTATEVFGSSDSRPATVQPPEPPPTTTKSNVSVTRIPPIFCSGGLYGRALGAKTPLLRRLWQERFHGAVLAAQTLVFAVIKSSKAAPCPFPKQGDVDTYPSHPTALARVAFSGSLRTGSIGAIRRWPSSFRHRLFEGAQRFNAGWSSPVARQAHNLKVIGSNPIPATNFPAERSAVREQSCPFEAAYSLRSTSRSRCLTK